MNMQKHTKQKAYLVNYFDFLVLNNISTHNFITKKDMSAYFQYMKSLNEARYKQLAQKLDFLLSNLHEDVSTQVRWVWQLIQNAKDVPNQFGKVKIRVTINKNSMTFSHNGDPFRPPDLESVVGQYSKKVEENNNETETTGKYGTGFVTTYVLSRKIKIKGILIVDDMQEDLEDSEDEEELNQSEQQTENQENSQSFADISSIQSQNQEKMEQQDAKEVTAFQNKQIDSLFSLKVNKETNFEGLFGKNVTNNNLFEKNPFNTANNTTQSRGSIFASNTTNNTNQCLGGIFGSTTTNNTNQSRCGIFGSNTTNNSIFTNNINNNNDKSIFFAGNTESSVSSLFKSTNCINDKQKVSQKVENQQSEMSEDSQPYKKVFQRFEVPLNRKYKNREKDFPRILKRNEIKIMKILAALKNQEPWQRNIDDFDTSFTYQKLDKTSFKMIAVGINTLKQYFPYALCFNKKLYEIQVIDERQIPQFSSFKITKEESQKLQSQTAQIQVAVCSITENEKTTKHYLAFKTDPKTRCTVAIPIDIGEKVRLLKINNKMPKAFKQFPLIGVKDTGYNFAFTSQNFYPNQTRSNLLLNKIEGRQNKKANQNWQALQSVMQLNISLTESLSTVVNLGQQNFIQVSQIPFMGNQHQTFKKYFGRYMKELIPNLKIVQFSNKNIRTLKDLWYMNDFSMNKNISNQEASTQINLIFSFLFKASEIMSAQVHKAWHENVNKNRKHFEHCVKFKNIDFCLSKISELKFQGLQQMLDSKEAVVQKMREIYTMLSKYRPSILDFKSNSNSSKIVLTNSYQLKQLNSPKIKYFQKLRVKTNLPKVYEELCKIFKINIDSYLIYDDLSSFFTKTQNFQVKQANMRIADFFQIQSIKKILLKYKLNDFGVQIQIKQTQTQTQTEIDYQENTKFSVLLRYLKSLKIGQELLQIIEQLVQYNGVKALEVDLTQFKQLSLQDKNDYLECAQKIFLKRVDNMIGQQSTVKDFSNKFVNFKSNTDKTIQWYNKILKMKFAGQLIKKNITWSLHFRIHKNIKSIKSYPDEKDVKMYNRIVEFKNQILKNEFNVQQDQYARNQGRKYKPRRFKQINQLTLRIVHPNLQYSFSEKADYKHFFQPLNRQFDNLDSRTKKQLLEYIHCIYQKNDLQKMCFGQLAKKRQIQLMKIVDFNQKQVSALYDFAQHKEVLPELHKIYSKFGLDKLMQIIEDYGQPKKSDKEE